MPCHVVRGVRCQADQCSSQVCHFSQSVSGGIWQPQRGASTEPLKRETVKRGGKKSHQSCWEWQCHRFGDENKPNYPRGKALWWRLLAEMSGSPAAFTCPGIPTSVWGMEKEGVTPKLCKHDFLNPTWGNFWIATGLIQWWQEAAWPESLFDASRSLDMKFQHWTN